MRRAVGALAAFATERSLSLCLSESGLAQSGPLSTRDVLDNDSPRFSTLLSCRSRAVVGGALMRRLAAAAAHFWAPRRTPTSLLSFAYARCQIIFVRRPSFLLRSALPVDINGITCTHNPHPRLYTDVHRSTTLLPFHLVVVSTPLRTKSRLRSDQCTRFKERDFTVISPTAPESTLSAHSFILRLPPILSFPLSPAVLCFAQGSMNQIREGN